MTELKAILYDLSEAAAKGKLEPFHGRDEQVTHVLEILSWISKNNILVLGHHEGERRQFVYGVALAAAQKANKDEFPEYQFAEIKVSALKTATVRILDMASDVVHEFHNKSEKILFVDDILQMLEAADDVKYPLGLVGSAIRSHKVRCIGTMSLDQYDRLARSKTQLFNGFKVVRLEPLSKEATFKELQQMRSYLEQQYNVQIGETTLQKAISFTEEYLPREHFPMKAVEILKAACAICQRRVQVPFSAFTGQTDSSLHPLGNKVGSYDIKLALTEKTAVDIFAAEAEKWKKRLAYRIGDMVFGQDAAISSVVSAMADIREQFSERACPAGVMIFGGPKGVGKSLTAKVLTYELMRSHDNYYEFDLAGSGSAGQADDLIRSVCTKGKSSAEEDDINLEQETALQVVTIKGIENSRQGFLIRLLKALTEDCGKTYAQGKYSPRKCLFILTININQPVHQKNLTVETLKSYLAMEIRGDILNKFDAIVPFDVLDSEARQRIVRRAMADFSQRGNPCRYRIQISNEAVEALAEEGYTAANGVVGMLAMLKQSVIEPVWAMARDNLVPEGGAIDVNYTDGRIAVAARP